MLIIVEQLGAFIGSLISYGTSDIEGPNAYRIPFALFFIIPCFILVGIYFSPEVCLPFQWSTSTDATVSHLAGYWCKTDTLTL